MGRAAGDLYFVLELGNSEPMTVARIFIVGLFCLVLPAAGAMAEPYSLTAQALQERYTDEVIAHGRYGAYAEAALQEGYPAIAHLFRALAASEAVHAQNFARLLRELGREPLKPVLDIELTGTQEHLQQAATVEADEIDTQYPTILQRIEEEGHQEAIRFITYAWKAEQQHRDLILKIKDAASWFFGMLVSRIEGNPTRYFVCRICGSTVMELPGGQCPICEHPPEQYREVPAFQASPTAPAKPAGAFELL